VELIGQNIKEIYPNGMAGQGHKGLLGPFDYLRLIRSCAHGVVKNALGQAPMFPHVLDLERYSLGDLGLTRFIPAIHNFMCDFLELGESLERPEANTKFSSYAEAIKEAFDKGPGGALVFYDKDGLGASRKSVHTMDMLQEEGKAASFLFSGRKRVLVTVPLIHSFGFIYGLLIPRLNRLPAIDISPFPDLSGYPLQKGDLVVLFPQLLKKLVLSPPPDVTLISSASPPLEEGLFKAARSIGYLSLTEIYGTSLTGSLGYRKGAGPYELFSHFTASGQKIMRPKEGLSFTSHKLLWRKERSFSRFESQGS
jgi:hypothetical protein